METQASWIGLLIACVAFLLLVYLQGGARLLVSTGAGLITAAGTTAAATSIISAATDATEQEPVGIGLVAFALVGVPSAVLMAVIVCRGLKRLSENEQ